MPPQWWSSSKPFEPQEEPEFYFEGGVAHVIACDTCGLGCCDIHEQNSKAYCCADEDSQGCPRWTSASTEAASRGYLKITSDTGETSLDSEIDIQKEPFNGVLPRQDSVASTGSGSSRCSHTPQSSGYSEASFFHEADVAQNPASVATEIFTTAQTLQPTGRHSCPPRVRHCDREQALGRHPIPLLARTISRAQRERGRGCGLVGELCPGDVLNIADKSNAVTRIGVAGGFLGHVLLVVSTPQPIHKRSHAARALRGCATRERELCTVDIVECTRGMEGLFEVKIVLSLDEDGRVFLSGEYDADKIVLNEANEEVHIWHSPPQFRKGNFHAEVMDKVLEDMRSNQQNWSWSTAVRAFFLSSEIYGPTAGHITMKEVQDSWEAEPICTSVVVTFWQMYLHDLARLQSKDPLAMILQVMPLRADRVLPGELISTMLSRGWSLWQGPAPSQTTIQL